jgi:hypothetical protein
VRSDAAIEAHTDVIVRSHARDPRGRLRRPRIASTIPYVVLALALLAFGVAGLFSIGAPFLLTGLAMLVAFPWRRRPAVVWPAIAGVWGFTIGYVLVAPLGCTSTSVPALVAEPVPVGRVITRCNGVFFDYVGGATYRAPLLPATIVAIAAALVTAVVARVLISSRGAEGTPTPR